MREPFTTTYKNFSFDFIRPQGKRLNKPFSLGLEIPKVTTKCPICGKTKENESAMHCKSCHGKALKDK